MRSTDTAEVEGLWLVNRPKCLVPRHPDDSNNSPKVQLHSPFIVPSLLQHKIFSWLHIVTSWSSTPFFQWENHCTCALVLPWFICKCTSIHFRIPYYYESSKPHCLFSNPLSMPVTYIYVCSVLVCKACMFDWLGRTYIFLFGVEVIKESMLNWWGDISHMFICYIFFVWCSCIQGIYAQLRGVGHQTKKVRLPNLRSFLDLLLLHRALSFPIKNKRPINVFPSFSKDTP